MNDISDNPQSHFPVFTIKEIIDKEKLSGSLNSNFYKSEKWIDDKCLGYLMNEEFMVYGRYHKKNDIWLFSINKILNGSPSFNVAQQFKALDGYWGERVALVNDTSIEWKKCKYNKENDHEHCAICWATIRLGIDYMRGNHDPVCFDCYKNYVVTRNYGFIQTAKNINFFSKLKSKIIKFMPFRK